MDPKPDELNNLQTLDAVCAWAGVSDATFLRLNKALGGADTARRCSLRRAGFDGPGTILRAVARPAAAA